MAKCRRLLASIGWLAALLMAAATHLFPCRLLTTDFRVPRFATADLSGQSTGR
jgi:hypothetical protein